MTEQQSSEYPGAGPQGPAPLAPGAGCADAPRPGDRFPGGRPYYGAVAGILVFDSAAPRAPGDPGHAATFSFPVLYQVIQGFTFEDLRTYAPERLTPVLDAALRLQERGVHFIITDCGLFSLYQRELSATLDVPFVGSSLSLIPFVLSTLTPTQKVGILTGHTTYLSKAHLQAVGADLDRLAIEGMENCAEFVRVVMNGGSELDLGALRHGTLDAANRLLQREPHIGALILECPNLATFRADLVAALGIPVFDVVSVADLFATALRLQGFPLLYPHRT